MLNIETLLLRIRNRRPVVLVVPVVVGLFLGGMLVVKPAMDNLSRIKSDIASLQEKVSAYLFVSEGESKLSEYKKRFSGDKTWLIEQINLIAENSGVSILSILPEEPGKVGDYLERNSVRIDAESDYHQLGVFVSQLESLAPFVKILSVDINTAGDVAGKTEPGPAQGSGPRAVHAQYANVYQVGVSVGLFTPIAGAL